MRIYPFFMLSLCLLSFPAEAMDEMDPMDAERLFGGPRKKATLPSYFPEKPKPTRSKRSTSLPNNISQTTPSSPAPFRPVNASLGEEEDTLSPLPTLTLSLSQLRRSKNALPPQKRKSLPLPISTSPQYYLDASLAYFKVGDMPNTLNSFKRAEKLFHQGKIIPLHLPQKLDSKLLAFLACSSPKFIGNPNFKDNLLCKYYFRREEQYFLEQATQPNTPKKKINEYLWEHIKYEHLADTGEHLQLSPEAKEERIKTLRKLIPQK